MIWRMMGLRSLGRLVVFLGGPPDRMRLIRVWLYAPSGVHPEWRARFCSVDRGADPKSPTISGHLRVSFFFLFFLVASQLLGSERETAGMWGASTTALSLGPSCPPGRGQRGGRRGRRSWRRNSNRRSASPPWVSVSEWERNLVLVPHSPSLLWSSRTSLRSRAFFLTFSAENSTQIWAVPSLRGRRRRRREGRRRQLAGPLVAGGGLGGAVSEPRSGVWEGVCEDPLHVKRSRRKVYLCLLLGCLRNLPNLVLTNGGSSSTWFLGPPALAPSHSSLLCSSFP